MDRKATRCARHTTCHAASSCHALLIEIAPLVAQQAQLTAHATQDESLLRPQRATQGGGHDHTQARRRCGDKGLHRRRVLLIGVLKDLSRPGGLCPIGRQWP